MRKKTDQPVKKVSTIPDSTSLPSHGKTSDGNGGDSVSCPQKGEEEEKIVPEKSCAGQRQSNDVECHTHDGNSDIGMAEKRPLEIRYQHHNLRSRMKKVKKEESKETPTVSSSPASANKKEHGKSGESPKGEKTEVKKVKRWEAWTNEDTDDFFDALCEHGRDFDAIQRHIEKGHKKRGLAPEQSRNKDQVRHLYYRTCHKVFKFIEPRKDLNRNDRELHALINYGELRRKLKGIAMQKQKWRKLTELIQTGVTTLRINGRNMRLKTPVCKALKALFVKEGKEPVKHVRPQKLPAKVTIDLRPIDNATWAAVQSMSYNPRIRVNVHLQKKITSLIKVLSERMIPDGGRREMESTKEAGKNATPRMIFTIPHGVEVQPYEDVCGKYVLDNCRAPITLKLEQIPEGYCKKKTLNEALESALDTEEENAPGMSPLKSLPDCVTEDKTLSAEKVVQVSDILSEKEGSHLNQTDQGSSDSTDRLLSMTPPSQGLTTPSLFDPGGIFNGLDSQGSDDVSGKSLSFASLSTFSSLNSGQDPKFDTQPQIGALVKSQKTGAVVGNTIIVPSTGEVGNLANNDFMSLNSISDVNILQTDEDSGDKLDCSVTLRESQMPSVVTDGEGLKKDLSPVTNNLNLMADKETDDASPQEETTKNADETDLKVFSTKDDILRQGLTVNNSEHISLVDIYLMLGKPAKLGFEYSFIGEESEKWKTNSMLTKLVMLARNELNMNAKPETKFVSVGVLTSPVKVEPPPQSFANRSTGEINLTYKPDTSHTAPLITQNGQLALHINPLPPEVQQGHQVSDQRKDFQFARPIAPAPIPVINARGQVNNGEGNTVSLNPSSFIVPRIRKRGRPAMVVGRILVPSASPKSSSQLFREQGLPLPGQRTIRPRPIMPNNKVYGVRKVVTGGLTTVASVLSTSKGTGNVVAAPGLSNDILSQAAISANINPSSFNPLSLKPSVTPKIQKPGITTTETSQVIKNLPLVLNNNKETVTLGALPPMEFPSHQGSSAVSSIQVNGTTPSTSVSLPLSLDAPINVSVSGLSQLNTRTVVSKASCEEPKSPTSSHMLSLGVIPGLSTPKSSNTVSDRSFMNTPTVSIHDKTSPASAALNISPPNLASLLDISLSSVDGSGNSQDGILSGFRERLHELTKNPEDSSSNVTISLAAALASTTVSVPKGGDVSPGGENHWLNGENTEMSLGSLLDQLEMTPERKSVTLTSSTPNSSLNIPPPVLLAESSRDSVISKDMDAHLQAMLNENSLDYVAKFADLAAHIAASSTEEETVSTTGQQSQLGHTTER